MAASDFMSEVLNGILESLGLDEENRQRRMRCQVVYQMMQTWIDENIDHCPVKTLAAGSSYETTTVHGLSSDIDSLLIDSRIRVIQDMEQCIQGDDRNTYMIDETDCYMSYVKLYTVSSQYPGPYYMELFDSIPDMHVVDENGKLLLSSKSFINKVCIQNGYAGSHGPAMIGRSVIEADFVIALPCDFFPRSALRWKERQTSETLPRVGESIIAEANHCHVVPVGNKSGPNESVEWRYSFTHIERELVHSWNNVQYKLYVMMKLILRELISPYIPDVISSYHTKTIMFWMNEEYSQEFFEASNLGHCLFTYLTNLSDTVKRKSLPHYFIEECNLYHNKMDEEASRQLTQIIQHVMNTWPRSLFNIKRRDLGSRLYHVLNGFTPLHVMCDCINNERRELHRFELVCELGIVHMCMNSSKTYIGNTTLLEEENLLSVLEESSKTNIFHVDIKNFISLIKKDFKCNTGILCLIKKALHPNTVHTSDVIRAVTYVQRYVNDCCIDTRLKVAAYLVFTGDFQEGSALLDRVERQIKPYIINMCYHRSCHERSEITHVHAVHDYKPTMSEYATHYTTIVMRYRPEMIGHLPKALVYEMFRSTSLSPSVSDIQDHFEWHHHAIIQCPVFIYFLRFVIARAKCLYADCRAAIDKMKRTSKQLEIAKASHTETNHNVIGHCHMELGDTRSAYRQYRESLKIKTFDNAAIWHIALLLRRQIRGEL